MPQAYGVDRKGCSCPTTPILGNEMGRMTCLVLMPRLCSDGLLTARLFHVLLASLALLLPSEFVHLSGSEYAAAGMLKNVSVIIPQLKHSDCSERPFHSSAPAKLVSLLCQRSKHKLIEFSWDGI